MSTQTVHRELVSIGNTAAWPGTPSTRGGGSSGLLPGRGGEVPDVTLDTRVVATLAALGSDMPGFMDQLVGEFTDSVQRHTRGMRLAILHGDAEGLGFAAHSLKGSCGIIGARRMAAMTRQVEESAYRGGDETLPLVLSVEAEYKAVRVALEAALSADATSLRP
jgi:HPt (histidine-containing phosphotransfer) domain-containing protein